MKNDARQAQTLDTILRVVIELLEAEGYDGIKLRSVAMRAHVSLSTVYKNFGTREALIVSALERWMEENCYAALSGPTPESLADGLLSVYRSLFEPWGRSPRILEAYQRARLGPGGHTLDLQGAAAVQNAIQRYFEDLEPTYAGDLGLVLTAVVKGVLWQVSTGKLQTGDSMRVLERAVFRLTSDNSDLARPRQRSREPKSAAG